jgi:glycosyltransferase involved in cell wall biosynthesis
VVAPTYNNARTLPAVLRGIAQSGVETVVVDDGSTDATAIALEAWRREAPSTRHVVTHPINRGKAAALRSGFARAAELGFTHLLTIDTDGQLDPAEIPALLEASRRAPEAFILGRRDLLADDYPMLSRLGRRASNAMVRIECGLRIDDSQCGFRVYPLALILPLTCRAARFGYETEILTRAGWARVPVRQVPVGCIYNVPGGRVSHLQPLRDTLRAVGMHARLLAMAYRRRSIEAARPQTEMGQAGRQSVYWVGPSAATGVAPESVV